MSLHPQSRQLIKLTTHPSNFGVDPEPLKWGAREPLARGPVVATVSRPGNRNAIGAHGGTYSVYRAVAMAAQKASSDFVPDYTNTLPPEAIGPFDAWFGTKKIVSLDPWGHVPQSIWADRIADRSLDIRPTIAVTKSHLDVPEIKTAVADGRMKAGGAGGLDDDGNLMTTKAAIEPVWYLPGVAERFGVDEGQLRRLLYEQTGGMFPELVTRPDLKLFLPPINGVTVYIVGDVSSISKPDAPLVVRLHDESCAAPRNSARNYSARTYFGAILSAVAHTRSAPPSLAGTTRTSSRPTARRAARGSCTASLSASRRRSSSSIGSRPKPHAPNPTPHTPHPPCTGGAAGRRRAHRVLAPGGERARRGRQVPRPQRAAHPRRLGRQFLLPAEAGGRLRRLAPL